MRNGSVAARPPGVTLFNGLQSTHLTSRYTGKFQNEIAVAAFSWLLSYSFNRQP
jgi:hypothetical protein